MLQFEEVAVMDKNSEFRGVPPRELMKNAGRRLAEVISNKFSERPVLFICGTGNNGGDAYVAARHLHEKWGEGYAKVYLIKKEEKIRTEISKENFEKFGGEVIEDIDWYEIGKNTIIVDALLGTGVKGHIREPYRGVIKKINEMENTVVSVDVPSGLGSDLSVNPDLTVTFHDVKEGMSEGNSGKILVKDIGIPEKAIDHTGPGEMLLYPRAKKDSHKGENGRLLIVGGGPYIGAPALAGLAAYRTGVDLVRLAIPESVSDIISSFSPNFLIHTLKGKILKESHVNKILNISEKCDSIIIGPGLGEDEKTLNTVRKLIEGLNTPMLIDADGLKAVEDGISNFSTDTVLTPHKNEFEMLVQDRKKDKKFDKKADDFAKDNSVVLVIKGKKDYITDGENYRWNDFGNEGMTVGGTGDTLSGVIGGLMSKGLNGFKSSRVGSYMTCRAGDIAFEDLMWGLTPEDIIENLPEVFKE